jgi:hypothetical protein
VVAFIRLKNKINIGLSIEIANLILLEELGEFGGSFDNELDEVRKGDVGLHGFVRHRVEGRGIQLPENKCGRPMELKTP